MTKLSASAGVTAPAGVDARGVLGRERRVTRGTGGDEAGQQSLAAGSWRQPPIRPATERDEAEPVATLRGEMTHGDGDAFGDIGLAAVGSAERHRRGDVEQEPRREGALRDEDAHVRDGRPRGHVPVDPADVVAGLVRTDLGELEAAPEVAGAVLPGDEATDPAPDAQVERADQHLGRRTRSGPVRGAQALRGDSRGDLRARQLRDGNGVDEPLEDHVRGDLLGQGGEARDDAVAKDVGRQLAHVGRQDVAAATDHCQGARGVDQVDRAARACPDTRCTARSGDGRPRPVRGSPR